MTKKPNQIYQLNQKSFVEEFCSISNEYYFINDSKYISFYQYIETKMIVYIIFLLEQEEYEESIQVIY